MPVIIDKVLRTGEGKILRKLARIADQVNSIEEDFEKLSDAELHGLTEEFRQRHADGESLDDLLPEAFATAREAAKRTLGQRHFDVQIMGGAALHMGNIAEMRTGEGKTLTAVLAAYLNALAGKGVHIVTVNDYLAKRDSEWMGRIHRFLGLEVGVILAQMTPEERRKAQEDAADTLPGVPLVTSTPLPVGGDAVHFTAAAPLLLRRRAREAHRVRYLLQHPPVHDGGEPAGPDVLLELVQAQHGEAEQQDLLQRAEVDQDAAGQHGDGHADPDVACGSA